MCDDNVNIVEHNEEIVGAAEAQPLYDEVSAADFAAVDLDALTAELRRVDRHALVDLFWAKVKEAAKRGAWLANESIAWSQRWLACTCT
jgi:hypothetical protein